MGKIDVGILTDEVSHDLAESLEIIRSWGIRRIELREGAEGRFPAFTPEEIDLVEEAVRGGIQVTAVSPGVFKGSLEDGRQLRLERDRILPEAMELAARFDCPTVIVFGFVRSPGEAASNRTKAMRVFEEAAQNAEGFDLTLAVENEPNFWVDRPAESALLFEELGHPRVRANWDPANVIWGGFDVKRSDFEPLAPFVRNVHVKDFDPSDEEAPWRPVGQGVIDWKEILTWIADATALEHVTLETHCRPLLESSRAGLSSLRELLGQVPGGAATRAGRSSGP